MQLLIILFFIFLPASAALPEAIVTEFNQHYKNAKERPDGLMRAGDKTWLLFKNDDSIINGSNLQLSLQDGDDLLFSDGQNNWIFLPLEDNTVKSFDFLHPSIQAKILNTNIVQSFLVPDSFKLPRDLAITMGRLPLELRTVELASDRELRFRERLKQEKESKVIDAISYSIKSGLLTELEFTDKAAVTSLVEQSTRLSYVSNMKSIDGDLYLLDYHKAKVYQFDAKEKRLEEFLSIEGSGLKDFAFAKETNVAYLLDSIQSKLLIFDTRSKKLIKSIVVPAASSDLLMVSRSPSEPPQIMMLSKSKSSLTTINSFDYQISKELDFNSLSKDFNYVPQAMAVNESHIFVAAEAVSKTASQSFVTQGKILVIDAVTHDLTASVDLDYIPYKLLISKNNRQVYALGSNKEAAFISAIDFTKAYSIETANLSPDIIDPRAMIFSNTANFLLIASAGTNTMAIFDIATWSMVHKIDIGDSSNLLAAF